MSLEIHYHTWIHIWIDSVLT